jgi:hypothetical protein
MSPKRKSAFFSATQEAQKVPENAVKPSDSENVVPLNSEAVGDTHGETVLQPSKHVGEPSERETSALQESHTVKPSKKEIKVSFYLTPEQAEKLDDLAYEHKKRTGKRINRNDIVRHFIDHCSIEDLHDIE